MKVLSELMCLLAYFHMKIIFLSISIFIERFSSIELHAHSRLYYIVKINNISIQHSVFFWQIYTFFYILP